MIRSIQIRLIAARAIHTGSRIVRDDQLGRSVEVFESGDVATDPVRQILVQCGFRESVSAGAQYGHKEGCRHNLTGTAVVDRNGRTRPIDKHLFAGHMLLPHDHVLIAGPALIQLTETAVAVSLHMALAILLPQQLQGDVLVSLELAMDFGQVQSLPRGLAGAAAPHREQQRIEPPVIAIFRQRPTQAGRSGLLQVSMNGRLTDRTTPGDLVLSQTEPKFQT
jgi:hypothetical protein